MIGLNLITLLPHIETLTPAACAHSNTRLPKLVVALPLVIIVQNLSRSHAAVQQRSTSNDINTCSLKYSFRIQ